MPDALGVLSKAALRKDRGLFGGGPAITYPTVPGATDLGTGHQIPFTLEGLVKSLNRQRDTSLVGSSAVPAAPIIEEVVGGPLTGRLRWRGMERLFCFALGFELPNGDDGSPNLIGTGEAPKTVTGATNATPIVITATAHGYATGDGVRIAGVTGNTAANGDWRITFISANTFSLDDSSGNGTFGGSPTAVRFPGARHLFEGDTDLADTPWQAEDGRDPGFNASDMKVRRFQVGIAKQVSDHVFYSSLVQKLTLAGNPQEVTITVDLLPYNRVFGSYNSASWTLPVGSTDQVLFRQLEAKLGIRSGGIGSLITVRPNSFELTIENTLKADDQTTESDVNHEIPVRDGFRSTRLKLEFPRYSDDTWPVLFDAGIEFMASLEFTGPLIATGINRLLGIYMGSCRMENYNAPIGGPSRIPQSLELVAEKPGAGGADPFAATKYGGIALKKDSEIVVVIQNEDHQNYLTEY